MSDPTGSDNQPPEEGEAVQPAPQPERPPVEEALLHDAHVRAEEVMYPERALDRRKRAVIAKLRAKEGNEDLSPYPYAMNDLGCLLEYGYPLTKGYLKYQDRFQVVVLTRAELEQLWVTEMGGFVYIRADGVEQKVDPEWVQDEFFILMPDEVGMTIPSDDEPEEQPKHQLGDGE